MCSLRLIVTENTTPTPVLVRVEIEYSDGKVLLWTGDNLLESKLRKALPEPDKTLRLPVGRVKSTKKRIRRGGKNGRA